LTKFMICSHIGKCPDRSGTTRKPIHPGLWRRLRKCGISALAEHVRATVPGSYILIQAIMSAIDDYAERETGNREYFWGRPHKAG
jgi:hypothetical protein